MRGRTQLNVLNESEQSSHGYAKSSIYTIQQNNRGIGGNTIKEKSPVYLLSCTLYTEFFLIYLTRGMVPINFRAPKLQFNSNFSSDCRRDMALSAWACM